MKKLLNILFCSLLVVCLSACSLLGPSNKDFTTNGMTITLTDEFYEKENVSFTKLYQSEKAIVSILKEEFDLVPEMNKDTSLEEYSTAVLAANNLTDKKLNKSTNGKYNYFEYERTANGNDFYYIGTVYKGTDAFWLINFACLQDDKDNFKETFLNWADTVKFE